MPAMPHTKCPSTNDADIDIVEAETTFIGEDVKTTIAIGQDEQVASFDQYLMSIVFMPHSLRMVCLTNLFCWMAHVRSIFFSLLSNKQTNKQNIYPINFWIVIDFLSFIN